MKDKVTGDSTNYSASDFRFGIQGSWNLGDTLFPYAALRLFGGPFKWNAVGISLTGQDIYHYQLAAGIAWQLESIY